MAVTPMMQALCLTSRLSGNPPLLFQPIAFLSALPHPDMASIMDSLTKYLTPELLEQLAVPVSVLLAFLWLLSRRRYDATPRSGVAAAPVPVPPADG